MSLSTCVSQRPRPPPLRLPPPPPIPERDEPPIDELPLPNELPLLRDGELNPLLLRVVERLGVLTERLRLPELLRDGCVVALLRL